MSYGLWTWGLENADGGAWVAQWVEHLTLDFASGHDPRVMGSSPVSGSAWSMERACDSLSLPLPYS